MSNDQSFVKETKIFRPGLRDHAIVGLTLGGGLLLLLFVVVGFIRGFEIVIYPLLVLLVWFFVAQLWLLGFRLSITEDVLEYREPFKKAQSIKKEAIKEGSFEIGLKNLRLPLYLLKVVSKDRSRRKLMINLKPFPFEAIQIVHTWLGNKATGELKRSIFFKK